MSSKPFDKINQCHGSFFFFFDKNHGSFLGIILKKFFISIYLSFWKFDIL